jgi:hypothetical protein
MYPKGLDLHGKRSATGKGVIVDYLATNPANRTAAEAEAFGALAVGVNIDTTIHDVGH